MIHTRFSSTQVFRGVEYPPLHYPLRVLTFVSVYRLGKYHVTERFYAESKLRTE